MDEDYMILPPESITNTEKLRILSYVIIEKINILVQKRLCTRNLTWKLKGDCDSSSSDKSLKLILESNNADNASDAEVTCRSFGYSDRIFVDSMRYLPSSSKHFYFAIREQSLPISKLMSDYRFSEMLIIEIKLIEEKTSALISINLLDNFYKLFNEKKMTDVTLVVEDTEIKAHKAILAAQSPVFSAMFEHDMLEKQNNRVIIEQDDPELFSEMLKFIYSGKLEDSKAEELLLLAEKYQINDLKSYCSNFIKKNINVDNAISFLVAADYCNAQNLLEYVENFITKNFKEIIKTETFKGLYKTNDKVIDKILDLVASKLEKI